MKREEQLKLCMICKNHTFNAEKEIICSLTNREADFDNTCSSYIEDFERKKRIELANSTNQFVFKNASKGKRFANLLLDLLFSIIFNFIISFAIAVIFMALSWSIPSFLIEGSKLTDYLFGFVINMIYYCGLEATTGRTIAKYITKTKVVNEKGEIPDFKSILIRTLCRYIPFEPFTFLGSDSSGLHDRVSNTRVIDAE